MKRQNERSIRAGKSRLSAGWLLFGLVFLLPGLASAQDATAILDKVAANYEKSGGVAARFTMHLPPGQEQNEVSGMLDMHGDRFRLLTPVSHIFFDGATQWVYLPRTKEVNVSNPSTNELMLNNLSFLLKHYKSNFTASRRPADEVENMYVIELKSKKKDDISRIVLSIGKKTYWPSGMQVTMKGGEVIDISISDLKTGVNQPESFFVFKEADYPNAEIIDLR